MSETFPTACLMLEIIGEENTKWVKKEKHGSHKRHKKHKGKHTII